MQPQGEEESETSLIVKKKATSFKDHIIGSLILIMNSGDVSLIRDCLHSIKLHLTNQHHQDEVGLILLSDSTNALPILALTLALPELVSTSIAIFLALSFLTDPAQADTFTSLMQEPITFELFQYSLIQNRHTSFFEDFIVVLQKLTTKDPVTMRHLMNSRLIETLNTIITPGATGGGLRESKMSNKEAQAANDFVITNIRSILKNISA